MSTMRCGPKIKKTNKQKVLLATSLVMVTANIWHNYFHTCLVFGFWFGATPSSAQASLMIQTSLQDDVPLLKGSLLKGSYVVPGIWNEVSNIQGKCLNPCAILSWFCFCYVLFLYISSSSSFCSISILTFTSFYHLLFSVGLWVFLSFSIKVLTL